MSWRWALAIVALTGCDRFLQLSNVPAPPPDGPSTCARSISTGRTHTCVANKSGDVYCWGTNYNGESSPGGPPYVLTATRVVLPLAAVQVATGKQMSCARL